MEPVKWLIMASVFSGVALASNSYATDLDDAKAAYAKQDYAGAFKLLQPLADSGNSEAEYMIGQMYYQGSGVSMDLDKAAYWYNKSKEQDGDSQSANVSGSSDALNLTCSGGGSARQVESSSVNIYGSNGGSAWGSGTSTSHVGFDDQVDVRLFSGDDRIRLPRIMLPTFHGGADGWFKLKDAKISEREITAIVGVNIINTPKVRIDRVTGNIQISGLNGNYVGQCRKLNPAVDRPKF